MSQVAAHIAKELKGITGKEWPYSAKQETFFTTDFLDKDNIGTIVYRFQELVASIKGKIKPSAADEDGHRMIAISSKDAIALIASAKKARLDYQSKSTSPSRG